MTTTRKQTDLMMVVTSDIAGQLRGKAIPLKNRQARERIGVGWTPTNTFITSFGPIADSPWGALGDLMLRPDMSTLVDLELPDYGVDECFALGNVFTLGGERWECCLRGQLMSAIERLRERHGLVLTVAFEHEFHFSGCEEQPGFGYALRAMRRLGNFPDRLMDVLDRAGLALDTFMPEFGPGQCEVTIGPQSALRAADEAIMLRELTRSVARGLDATASFAPILDPSGVGNGVHVHFSLQDVDGGQVNFDGGRTDGVSESAGSFVAGILKYMPALIALTASSVSSYMRLTPHRWSAAFNNFGRQDREAAVRICPVFRESADEDVSDKFHFEYRAADAAVSPYLLLAALINAGLSGLDEKLSTPQTTHGDLTTWDDAALAARNIARLPTNLPSALDFLQESAWARVAFGETLVDAFVRHKRCEVEIMDGLTDEEICRKYAQAY
jgi:glutamine synthetase